MSGYVYRGRSPRQELEAKIWRWWPTRGPEAAHAVDAILAAADIYVRETGRQQVRRTDRVPPADPPAVTAARRQELDDATCPPRPVLHLQVFDQWAGPACDPASGKPCTTERGRVSCGACKQTAAWREAAA